jgi:hypothetical protein
MQVQVIDEKTSPDEKEACIRRAVTSKSVTLLTRDFGRGTDFIVYDDQLNTAGGVHVGETEVGGSGGSHDPPGASLEASFIEAHIEYP